MRPAGNDRASDVEARPGGGGLGLLQELANDRLQTMEITAGVDPFRQKATRTGLRRDQGKPRVGAADIACDQHAGSFPGGHSGWSFWHDRQTIQHDKWKDTARMTWSIVAHDPNTDAFAVAVATKAFAVGALCPFVRSGVGAVATQSLVNRYLAPAVLDGMARGLAPAAAIEGALVGDEGQGIRQIHAVDRHGRTAAWTGQNCVEWCGSVSAGGVSVAGNMLAGEAVVAATLQAWKDGGALDMPERLMAAMDAGQAAGGDRRGRQSA